MNFKQRLFRYLIGVTIGILISLVFFRDKLGVFTSWFPDNVVKSRLEDSYWSLSPQSACLLDCLNMDVKAFKAFTQQGDIDFEGSKTKGKTKEYRLVFDSEEVSSARFAVKDSSTTIIDIATAKPCDCP